LFIYFSKTSDPFVFLFFVFLFFLKGCWK